MDTETQLAFMGTKEEQKVAGYAFEVMKRKGMLFAANAPIRMSVESIAKALTKEGGPMTGDAVDKVRSKVEAALSKNGEVFARTDSGDFATTKAGRAYHTNATNATGAVASANAHTFKDRLNTEAVALDVEAAKEYAESLVNRAVERAERVMIIDSPMIDMRPLTTPPPSYHAPHITFDNTTVIPQHLIPQPPPPLVPEEPEIKAPTPYRLAAETIAPLPPIPPPVAPFEPAGRGPQPVPERARPEVAPAPQPKLDPAVAESMIAPAEPAPPPTQASEPQPQSVAEAEATPPPPKSAAAARKEPPAVTGPVEIRVATTEGPITIDLRQPVDDILANKAVAASIHDMIAAAVEEDSRLVRFGSDIFPEEAIERFSKGDFRRIKDFLDEPDTGGVASDHDFMDYVLNRRPENPDYERLRFSLNYRLLKEKKDFEFVGIDSNRLWMNAGAVPVAAPKRKPAEIGQDYRFLEDPATASVEEEDDEAEVGEAGPLEYSLTYYEYENGVLPYDRRAKSLFRGPVLEDQRASLIQLELPQLYASLLVELRYPTGNRGGFLMGLADFFAEHLVPGAKFTIVPTDRAENIFELHFTRTAEQETDLLQFDERKGRYVFRPVSFTAETDPAMLLTQTKFGKLHNQKKLEESERKRVDVVLTNAFEAVGENTDGKYWAILDDIYAVINIERPISRSWLKTLLSGAYPFFYSDESTEGFYFYDPSRRPS